MLSNLSELRVAVLASDGFEEAELTEPVAALREAGAQVDILSVKKGSIQGVKHMTKGSKVKVTGILAEARPEEYDGVMLPGGAVNADFLRMLPEVQNFLREMNQAGKPMAAICHAPWELISAGLVMGRTLTSYHTIQDDIRNAGGTWVDREVAVDGNWVTSRQPSDLPAFNREMLDLFSRTGAFRTAGSAVS
jgi:protease I